MEGQVKRFIVSRSPMPDCDGVVDHELECGIHIFIRQTPLPGLVERKRPAEVIAASFIAPDATEAVCPAGC